MLCNLYNLSSSSTLLNRSSSVILYVGCLLSLPHCCCPPLVLITQSDVYHLDPANSQLAFSTIFCNSSLLVWSPPMYSSVKINGRLLVASLLSIELFSLILLHTQSLHWFLLSTWLISSLICNNPDLVFDLYVYTIPSRQNDIQTSGALGFLHRPRGKPNPFKSHQIWSP